MNRALVFAVLGLALSTVIAGSIAWRQSQRLAVLEAELAARDSAAGAPSGAGLEPRSFPAGAEAVAPPTTDEPAAALPIEAAEEPRGRRGGPALRLNELMEDPAFAAAWQTQQRARLDGPYAALFRKLNLNPAQIDQLKTLLAERQAARMDVMSAAREQGLGGRDNRDELRALMDQAQSEVDASIRELLGDSGFAAYQQYERTAPQRTLVNQLESRLSYSGAPLSGAQADALVAILAESSSQARGFDPVVVSTGAVPIPGGMEGNVSEAAIARAQGVLAPAQVEALRQLQAEQQAQRRVNELMRERFNRERANPAAPPPQG